ncbi:AraC family transcriptional regulator [Chitinibacteraceae bacterium HSL-7]
MATIYYERFELADASDSDVARHVGARAYHDASCPTLRQYGVYMCGVGSPDGPLEIERIDAPFHVLLVLLDGEAELFEGDQHWPVQAGQLAVLPARGRRGYRRTGSRAMRHVWFLLNDDPRWSALARNEPWVANTGHGGRLYDAVSLLQREARLANDGRSDTLVAQALDIVSRLLESMLGLSGSRSEYEQALLQVLDDIRCEPAHDWSVPELCARVGLGSTQLYRLCQKLHGRAPAQLVLDTRMQLAQDWLRQGRRVADVATALGYQEIASFSRRFSGHFGCAPSRLSPAAVQRGE